MSRKLLVENIFSLFVVQATNYLLPLVTFPYLVRTLGFELFGLFSFALAFIQYFVVFVDYGYNLTATRQIALIRDDRERLGSFFSTVLFVKLTLMIACFGIVILIVVLFQKFQAHADLYLISFLAVVGNVLYPIWFLQGMERIKLIAAINFAVRLATTVLIFLCVRSPRDVTLAVLIQSSGSLLSGVLSTAFVFMSYRIAVSLPSLRDMALSVRDGFTVFVTVISSTLFNTTAIVVLGLFCSNTVVGQFSIAEKIIRVFINFISPISVAVFPRVGSIMQRSREEGVRLLRTVLGYGAVTFLMASVGIFIFAAQAVRVVSGSWSPETATYLRIIALLPATIFIDNIYGTQLLVNIDRTTQFMKSVLFPGIASVVLSFLFVPVGKAYASSIIYLCSELAVMLMMIYYTKREGIQLLPALRI